MSSSGVSGAAEPFSGLPDFVEGIHATDRQVEPNWLFLDGRIQSAPRSTTENRDRGDSDRRREVVEAGKAGLKTIRET